MPLRDQRAYCATHGWVERYQYVCDVCGRLKCEVAKRRAARLCATERARLRSAWHRHGRPAHS